MLRLLADALAASTRAQVLDGPKLDGSYCYWNHGGEPLPPASAASNYGGNDSSGSAAASRPAAEADSGEGASSSSGGSAASSDPYSVRGAAAPLAQEGLPSSQPPGR